LYPWRKPAGRLSPASRPEDVRRHLLSPRPGQWVVVVDDVLGGMP
jgi:adenine/guanine phosphoribosyltransferase-like PRPP-binding protein